MRRLAPFSLVVVLAATLGVGPSSAQVPDLPIVAPQVLLTPVPGVFDLPVAMATRTGDDALYIVEKTGRIRAVRGGVIDPSPVLDLSSEVSDSLEQGLLGLAFSPNGELMYVNLTDTSGDTRVLEFAVSDGAAVPESRRELLVVEQPFANHNAGTMAFGPDGYLYIALGDGGGAGDPQDNAQSLDTLLGKMLRIDPAPSGEAEYTVPDDNPFVGTDARPEIWAYGLRNPWKFSFDRHTGDLWTADVGQSEWEEINLQRAGAGGGQNYGWNRLEGSHPFQGAEPPDEHVLPVHEYPNEELSCSVTGGHLYRGEAIPSLQGAYVYADWCDGHLRFIREVGGEVVEDEELGVVVPLIASFGEDHDGELYAISMLGLVFRIDPLLP